MTSPDRNQEHNDNNLLTGIRQAYTVGNTSEPETEDMNQLIVRIFINTLAEVSLSIASRKAREKKQ